LVDVRVDARTELFEFAVRFVNPHSIDVPVRVTFIRPDGKRARGTG
jgi:hypothetical protein